MSDDKKDNDQDQLKQKGVGKFTASVGQSSLYSTIFGGVAAAVGALIGASRHDEEAQKSTLKKIGGMLRSQHSNYSEALKKDLIGVELKELVRNKQVTNKELWNVIPRGKKALLGGVLLGVPVAIVASFVGAFKGAKKADEAKEQFKEITGENKNIKEKLADTESRLAASEASMAQVRGAISNQPEQQKSHVANLNAERAAQAAQISQAAI